MHALRLSFAAGLSLLGLNTACIQDAKITKIKEVPENTKDCDLVVYSNVSSIFRPYEQVCRIEKEIKPGETPRSMVEAIRAEACACGGEAVLVAGEGEPGPLVAGERPIFTFYVLKFLN